MKVIASAMVFSALFTAGGVLPAMATAEKAPTGPYVIGMAGEKVTDADQFPGTLCTGEDWVVFSGTSKTSGKIVSICMAEGDDTTPGHLTYRYGKPGAVEMIYPAAEQRPADAFTLRVYTRSRTTYVKFEFHKAGYEYAILEGSDGPGSDASLRVTRVADGTVVADHDLTVLTDPFALMHLNGLVATGPFDE